jgi:hypothetical protein
MATTQPPLRYWGYEKSVRNDDCDFIRRDGDPEMQIYSLSLAEVSK